MQKNAKKNQTKKLHFNERMSSVLKAKQKKQLVLGGRCSSSLQSLNSKVMCIEWFLYLLMHMLNMICYIFLLKIMPYIPTQGYPQGCVFPVPEGHHPPLLQESHNSAFPVAAFWQLLKSQHTLLYFQITSL